MKGLAEADWESLALDTLGELAWRAVEGKRIAPGSGERESWAELTIPGRLRDAVARLNPELPPSAVDDVVAVVLTPTSGDALTENHRMHRLLTGGVRSVVYTDEHGEEHNPTVRLVDSRDPYANDFLAANQVTVVDGDRRRRFDVVLYLNGLPVGVIELKRADDQYADLRGARAQLDTYLAEFPLVFAANVVCLVSDGITARYGTAFTPMEHFAPWNVDETGAVVEGPTGFDDSALNLALHGLFEQRRFVDLLGGFVSFSHEGTTLVKRIAKPHQYFAVTKAVATTVEAVRSHGKAGVVWHTQGSG